MSKAKRKGVSPWQASYHAKVFSSAKVMAPEQPGEYVADGNCNGLSEGKHGLDSEILQSENGGLNPNSEDAGKSNVIGNTPSSTLAASKELGSIPKGGVVCGLASSKVIKSRVLKKKPRSTNTVLSTSIVDETLAPEPEDLAKNFCNRGSELRLGDTSITGYIGKCSNHHQGMPVQVLQFSSDEGCAEPSGGIQSAGFELVHNGQTKLSDDSSLTMSVSVESLRPPHGSAMGTPEKLQPYNVDQKLETPSKDLVTDTVHTKHRVENDPASSSKKRTPRSTNGDQRVLRSREKTKVPQSSNHLATGNPVEQKQRKKYKKRREKDTAADEYSRIRKHLRYLLNRISYEQSLITAYSAEGWKGLSLEKLKPEKELQRASSEIFRRKSKIRDLFQRIDSLCTEGKFPASIFDAEGQIDSEDIFCAKCGSKDLTIDNDIILCDGACDRGFHQFCLLPPLLKEDIPPDDEGWLCPGCDCKVDCIDLLNKYHGIKLSISDIWEKVFPEAASTAERNPEQDFGLPSEDSDDNDYSPDGPDVDENSKGNVSSSDESDSTSASDESDSTSASDESDSTSASEGQKRSPDDEKYAGLPSDDSEDDDFNPDALGLEEDMKHETSSSHFPSDDSEEDGLEPILAKRNVEKLDYKKLYDETYGNDSSDSCDDEDFAEDFTDDEDFGDTIRPSKKKKKSSSDTAPLSANEDAMVPETAEGTNQNLSKTEHTPKRRSSRKSNFENGSASSEKAHQGTGPSTTSSGKRVRASAYKQLGEAVTQRLHSYFKVNRYPTRATKESMAKELGITFQQVDKWFGNARWSFNRLSLKSSNMAASTLEKESSSIQETNERVLEPQPEPEGVARDVANNNNVEESPTVVIAVAAAATKSGGAKSRGRPKQKSEPSRKSRRR